MKRLKIFAQRLAACLIFIIVLISCSDSPGPMATSEVPNDAMNRPNVVLQTDWYAQPEHAGFYHALHAGFYEEEGLEVEVRPGANMSNIPQLVATGRVQFALGTSDNTLMAISRGIPLVSVFPYFQHDPQCIMSHKSLGLQSLMDLDGRRVMINPGAGYVQFLQKSLGIRLQIVPLDYSLTRFLSDPDFIQQCFITNEPFYVTKEGIEPMVIPLSQSGFDPYRQVYAEASYVQENPDIVAAFMRASIRGWQAYVDGDGNLAHAAIAELNPQHTEESMSWSKAAMQEYQLTHGDPSSGEVFGKFDRERIMTLIRQLTELELLDGDVDVEKAFPLGLPSP